MEKQLRHAGWTKIRDKRTSVFKSEKAFLTMSMQQNNNFEADLAQIKGHQV